MDKFHNAIIGIFTGTILSTFFGLIISVIDLKIISYLNSRLTWSENFIRRVISQVFLTVFVAVLISLIATIVSNYLNPYDEDFKGVLLNNALIFSVVNVLFMTILEGWIFFFESNSAKQVTGDLKYELSQVQFDILKSQINPHFMFSSLNILSDLIKVDVIKAQKFIDDFSIVYRYVAETIEKPLVPLGRELDFVYSYLNLQKMRHGKQLSYTTKISGELTDYLLPPLSLQAVIEHSIQNNIINNSTSLIIEISNMDNNLVIRNRVNAETIKDRVQEPSLKYLIKRYDFVCNKHPEFSYSNCLFVANLPLINPNYENINY